jgi:hypothetical protein
MKLDEVIQKHTKALQLQAEVFDFVLFLEQRQTNQPVITDQQRKERLKKSLDKAVALNICAGVDGVAWQNELRIDNNCR